MAALIDAIDVKRKMFFEFENTPFLCLEAEVSTPTARGGQTLVRLKMRNLLTRAVFDKTFKASDKFKEPDLEMVPASYLYSDGDGSHFLDQESFETLTLSGEMIGDALDFLVEGAIIQLHKYNGNPIGLQLPTPRGIERHLHRTRCPRRHLQRQRDQARQAGDRHRNPRSPLHQRRRKSQGVHRNAGVRRAGLSLTQSFRLREGPARIACRPLPRRSCRPVRADDWGLPTTASRPIAAAWR